MFNPLKWLQNRRSKRSGAKAPQAPKTRLEYFINRLPPPKLLPSDQSLGLVRRSASQCQILPCAHPEMPRAVTYQVYGVEFRFPLVARCSDCTQTLFEILFERCAACGLGIPLTQQVAIAWVGAPHPYTHLACAEVSTLFCGLWGWGQLVPLNDIGDQFNPGVATVMQDSLIDQHREFSADPSANDNADETQDDDTPPDGTPKPGTN
ncbi:MAG: hypothetical protein WC866_03615 [Patescibacteria group bacterium]|jgi:hypothetical protein